MTSGIPDSSSLKLDFEPKLASIVKMLSDVSDRHQVPSFFVGGCVRDAILRRPILDLDLLIDTGNLGGVSVERFAQVASRALGGSRPVCFDRFGTYHLTVGGKGEPIDVEIVGANLAVSDTFEIEDPAEVMRRDFTANALLYGLNRSNLGRIYDLTGQGIEDIQRRILRCPIDPAITLADDPIRMLRAARLSCTLSFEIDTSVADFVRQHPTLIDKAAVERVRKELELIVLSDSPATGIDTLRQLNLLGVILPEIEALGGVTQDKRFHSEDVYNHTLAVLRNVEQKDPTLRLAALFHDVGKREAKSRKDERIIFYGHECIGASLVSQRLLALRVPNRLIKDVSCLVRNHMINYSEEWTDSAIRRLIKRLGPLLPRQLDLYEADIKALTDAASLLDSAHELRKRIETIDQKEDVARLEAPLNGHEICELLALKPGPLVGKYKARLLEAVLAGELPNDKKAAAEYLRKLARE